MIKPGYQPKPGKMGEPPRSKGEGRMKGSESITLTTEQPDFSPIKVLIDAFFRSFGIGVRTRKKLICPKCGSEKSIQQIQDGVTVFNDMSIDTDGNISYDLADVVLEDTSTVAYWCKNCGFESHPSSKEERDDLKDFIAEEEA